MLKANYNQGSQWIPIILITSVIAYLGIVLILPLTALIQQVVTAGFSQLIHALNNANAWHSLNLTLILALIAVIINGTMGIAGALIIVRHRFWGRNFLDSLVDLPLAISPVMTGLAFILIFGRGGFLAPILKALDWKVTFAFPGLVLGTLFVTFPFTLREVAYVLAELGTDEEEAAATLGASSGQIFWNVTLPNIRNGLGYGIVLTTARALGEFGAVLVLGGAIAGRTQTATTFIYNALEEREDIAAYGMALILAAISVILLGSLEWFKNHRQLHKQ